jgi:hypothetical protein
MRQMHEHASPGRAVAHQRAALDGLLGSAGLIVVVLANTEVQGAPQNSEYGDKCDAQQGNDDDEDQGCGHGAGIVAARRLLRHAGNRFNSRATSPTNPAAERCSPRCAAPRRASTPSPAALQVRERLPVGTRTTLPPSSLSARHGVGKRRGMSGFPPKISVLPTSKKSLNWRPHTAVLTRRLSEVDAAISSRPLKFPTSPWRLSPPRLWT